MTLAADPHTQCTVCPAAGVGYRLLFHRTGNALRLYHCARHERAVTQCRDDTERAMEDWSDAMVLRVLAEQREAQ